MPATRFSVLEHKPTTDLRPGETGNRLKDDPYYGKVDLGPTPKPDKPGEPKVDTRLDPTAAPPELIEKLESLEEQIKDGMHALDGEEQNHVEVITGKRLQQKTLEARPPEEPEGGALGAKAEKTPAAKAPVAKA